MNLLLSHQKTGIYVHRCICSEIGPLFLIFGFKTRELDSTWGCNIRADSIDSSLVTLMKKAGCTRFFIGVESGNQKISNFMHKNITTNQIRKAVSLAHEHDIKTTLLHF